MSLLNDSRFALGPNACPRCRAAGLAACRHVKPDHAPNPSAVKTELGPAASAMLLKGTLLAAIGAIGYLAWRSGATHVAESEPNADPQTPFDEWEPNQ